VNIVLFFLIALLSPFSLDAIFTGIGLRPLASFIDQETDSFLYHPENVVPDERPPLISGYVPRIAFSLDRAGSKVNWEHSMECLHYRNQWSAHFLLEAVSLAPESRELGVAIYLASHQAKEDGTYDIRIEITQRAPDAFIAVYDSAGAKLQGPVPLKSRSAEELKKPYLPWLAGNKQFYSVVCEQREEKMYLVLIQHTREEIHEYEHTSLLVREIIDTYSSHERLYNRPGAYLDVPTHMRCLPIPYVSNAYKVLLDGPLFVSWAAIQGELEVMPA